MENYTDQPSAKKNIEIDLDAKNILFDISKWSVILAIIGVIVAVCFLGMFFGFVYAACTMLSDADDYIDIAGLAMALIATFLGAVLGIYPIQALMRYNRQINHAITFNDTETFHSAMLQLRNLVRYIALGIIFAVTVSLLVFFAFVTIGTILQA